MGTILTFPPSDNTHDDEYTSSLYSLRLGEQEAILWDSGELSIEHWERQYTNNEALEHTLLSAPQVKKLRQFLNKPGVRQTLGLQTFTEKPAEPPAVSNIGRYSVETQANKSITIGTPNVALELNAAETHRLYMVLHELYQPQPQKEEQNNA